MSDDALARESAVTRRMYAALLQNDTTSAASARENLAGIRDLGWVLEHVSRKR